MERKVEVEDFGTFLEVLKMLEVDKNNGDVDCLGWRGIGNLIGAGRGSMFVPERVCWERTDERDKNFTHVAVDESHL